MASYRHLEDLALRYSISAYFCRDFFVMALAQPLSTALDELATAISQAEAAAGASAASQKGNDQVVELEAALAALRKEHMSLKNVSGDVAGRLESAIVLIEAILSGRS